MGVSKRLETIKTAFKTIAKFKVDDKPGRYCVFSYDDLWWLIKRAEILECTQISEDELLRELNTSTEA